MDLDLGSQIGIVDLTESVAFGHVESVTFCNGMLCWHAFSSWSIGFVVTNPFGEGSVACQLLFWHVSSRCRIVCLALLGFWGAWCRHFS